MRIFYTILFSLIYFISIGQSVTITGRVIDNDTEEGVPFANVFFVGTGKGVTTDIDGNYKITGNRTDSLGTNSIGYKTIKKPISTDPNQVINFRLGASSYMLTDVIILAGENPANNIVRSIIKNKKSNQPANIETYQVEEYGKVELDLDNISAKMRKRKLFKPFEFVFQNIDSTSDEKPFLPAYITEQIADIYHVKNKQPKKILKAQRSSGIKNQSIIEFIGTMHKDFSVYDNFIDVLNKPFVSPFARSGLFYYEYYMQDTMEIEGVISYKLKFKPKRKQESTFYGDFWVAISDSTFAIQRLNMRMSKGANINLVNRVIIYEEFSKEGVGMWLPKKQKMIIDFKATKKAPGLIGRKNTSYKDYKINPDGLKKEFKKKDPENYNTETLEKSKDYWATARHDKLSKTEASIYAMVDSVKNVPIYKTYVDIVQTLVSGYKQFGPVEFGTIFSLYSNNHIEGHRVRLGMRTTSKLTEHFRIGGYTAYGFKDKRIKYGGKFLWNVKRRPKRTMLGIEYKNDLAFTSSGSEEISGGGNLLSGFYRRDVPVKLMDRQEAKIFLDRDWKKGWSNKIALVHQYMNPYGDPENPAAGFNFKYLPNPDVVSDFKTSIRTTEIILTTRYAFQEKIIDNPFSRRSLGSEFPILELQYTAGIKDLFKGEYNYHKVTLGLQHWFNVGPLGWTSYRIKAGKTFGTLPFLLLEVAPGNETYFYSKTAFNGMNLYEFASDMYVSARIEHHFDGLLFNKIPLIRKLKLREVAHFKATWGTLSDANYNANRLNHINGGESIFFSSPDKAPYMEVGAGIENIFKLFRVDVMWRLNYLDNPNAQRFTVRFSFNFSF